MRQRDAKPEDDGTTTSSVIQPDSRRRRRGHTVNEMSDERLVGRAPGSHTGTAEEIRRQITDIRVEMDALRARQLMAELAMGRRDETGADDNDDEPPPEYYEEEE
ncbi:uncharacterized protein STEHIDRAFT_163816 [Stereum hirsutum FP-91666 SS1]|uniref:Uncharacterized protein n=1 Tax=Stereum hirsutum (strain FP-91666) TaxID=721885 RepID=R7RWW0_STEHR|nr:uncharacterized protein STEHIDRAFT_163816 [Stereum hirsutum FP-91666 SS1]EIM79293.1 hypothetical protein STEHIDRAFT_163816 [Stereum hirsutum FP-91666 SS1]